MYTSMYTFEAKTVLDEERTSQILVDAIKSWLAEEDIVPEMPEEMVIIFLLSCQNDVEMTKTTIKAYLKCKKNTPATFDDRELTPDLVSASELLYMSSIPQRTDQNDVIHFFRLGNTNPKEFRLIPMLKMAYMVLDVSQNRAPSPPDGLIVVADMKGAGFWHLRHFRLDIAKSFIHYIQEGLPIRLKAIYVLNANYVFYQLLALVKFLVKAELMKLIIPFSTYPQDEFLEKHLPARCMPADYGGDLPSLEQLTEETVAEMKKLEPFFAAEEKLRKSQNDKKDPEFD